MSFEHEPEGPRESLTGELAQDGAAPSPLAAMQSGRGNAALLQLRNRLQTGPEPPLPPWLDDGNTDGIAQAGLAGSAARVPHLEEMNQAFGVDFSDVTAHTGPEAVAACQRLDAQAYAFGSSVSFASPTPSRAVVAHELAHVVQQRGGNPSVACYSDEQEGPAGDLEEQAHRAAAQVMAGQRVTTRISGAGRRVSLLRNLGEVVYNVGSNNIGVWNDPLTGDAQNPGRINPLDRLRPDGNVRRQPVRSRTVDEWNHVLRSQTPRDPPLVERHAFLMKALGEEDLGRNFVYTMGSWYRMVSLQFPAPSQQECVALARALLNSGGARGESGTNAPDPGVFIAGNQYLVTEFLARYTGPALEAMSQTPTGGRELGSAHQGNVEAMAQSNEEHRLGARNGAVLGSSLGTACRHASEYLASHLPAAEGGGLERNRHTAVIYNSGTTIQAVLNGIEAFNEAQKDQAETAFDLMVDVANLGAVAAGVGTFTRTALLAIARRVKPCIAGLVGNAEPSMGRRRIIETFRNSVREFCQAHAGDGITGEMGNTCNSQFESGLNNAAL